MIYEQKYKNSLNGQDRISTIFIHTQKKKQTGNIGNFKRSIVIFIKEELFFIEGGKKGGAWMLRFTLQI